MREVFCPCPFKSNRIFHILSFVRISCIKACAEILRENSVDIQLKKMNTFGVCIREGGRSYEIVIIKLTQTLIPAF
jgi:hypothetical protein